MKKLDTKAFQIAIDGFEIGQVMGFTDVSDIEAVTAKEIAAAINSSIEPISASVLKFSNSITIHRRGGKQSDMNEWMRKVLDEGRPTAELLERDRRRFIRSFPRRWRMTVSQWCAKHCAEMEAMWALGGVEAWEVFDKNLTHQAMADKSRRAIRENKRDTMRMHSRRRGR